MKQALIYGNRICQVENESFPVAEPLFWVDVDDDVRPDTHEWRDGAAALIPETEPAPPVVPESVTMRQARLALLAAGKLTHVQTAIDALPEPQKTAARIEWEYSSAVNRNSEFVEVLGKLLGLDSDGIDNLFIAASKL